MVTAGVIIGILIVFYLFMIFPEKLKKDEYIKFAKRSYAHRGFHDNENGVPENSLVAFKEAVNRGYGIEMDLQLTKDKKLVVFHDDDLLRAAKKELRIYEIDYEELKKIKIFDSSETVPLFSEVLSLIDGSVPLIIEIKQENGRQWSYETCRVVYEELKQYKGDYCVESFDPFLVSWFKKNAHGIVRGQLSMAAKRYTGMLNKLSSFIASAFLLNFLCRPHFVAYSHKDGSFGLFLYRLLGGMTVKWTVTSMKRHEQLQKKCDAVIFEGYSPKPIW